MTNVEQAAAGGVSGSDQSTTEQANERVAETAQQVGEKAQEMRNQAGERVGQELDTRSTQAGDQVTTIADAVRRVSEQLRSEGNPGTARYADQVAERAERLGRYLTQADADKMLRDAENFARRQPWLAVVGGAAIGFLASRFVKASSANRYRHSYSGNGRYELPSANPGMASVGEGVAESPSRQPERSGGRGDV